MIIALSLFLLFLIPRGTSEKLREQCAKIAAKFSVVKERGLTSNLEIEHLKLKNELLLKQLQEIQEHLTSEERQEDLLRRLGQVALERGGLQAGSVTSALRKKEELLLARLKRESQALLGRVIYRDPAFWSSMVWINLGQKDNEALGYEVVAVNSPVVVGNAVVGIVEHVGKKSSRVRLLTDTKLSIAVRVIRGSEQNIALLGQLQGVLDQLKFREELFFSSEEQENTLKILSALEDNLQGSIHERYLAKGELRGSSTPLWRSRAFFLEGVGFNYDYEDDKGPARDLRTGKPFGKKTLVDKEEILLKEGDLLVTTGMDGVFPEGLHAAIIEHVDPLEEGAISYNLSAKPIVQNLHEMTFVEVLPPLR